MQSITLAEQLEFIELLIKEEKNYLSTALEGRIQWIQGRIATLQQVLATLKLFQDIQTIVENR